MSIGGNDLTARLGLDQSNYDRGLKNAQSKAGMLDRSLSKIGNSFANRFTALFSATAAVGLVRSVMNIADSATKLAKQYSITTHEAQLLAQLSEQTGESIGDMAKDSATLAANMQKARDQGFTGLNSDTTGDLKWGKDYLAKKGADLKNAGGAWVAEFWDSPANAILSLMPGGEKGFKRIMDRRLTPDEGDKEAAAATQAARDKLEAEELADKRGKANIELGNMEQKTAEMKRKAEFDALGIAEQRLYIEKQIKELGEDAAAFDGTVAGEQMKQEMLRKQAELAGLKPDAVAAITGQSFRASSDSLTSVGNFLGDTRIGRNYSGAGTNVQQEILTTLKSIDRNIQ